jgi:23S rRNA (guanine2445-N2)-methyltransferase / 23S rRNA (guanine2069-N7)-methyltransferase
MAALLPLFVTATKGTEGLLAAEVQQLGGVDVVEARGGVKLRGSLEVAYRLCLWSRVASRVLLPLAEFAAPTPQALYSGVRSIRWSDHLDARRTLAVDATASNASIGHSHFAALKTKDAIVDQIRERSGARPSVDVQRPDVRVNLYLHGSRAVVGLDLSGDALHRRGYRGERGAAPLKENLAAALLLFADWPERSRDRAPFLDPLCGSGTLPIEAAMMAANIAPGRLRSYFGFLGWRQHDDPLWRRLQREAAEVEVRDRRRLPSIRGSDSHAAAVRAALANVERAGLRGAVHIERQSLADCSPVTARGLAPAAGVIVTNPPYGERLADAHLRELYSGLGDVLRRRFLGWTAHVLTANLELGRRIGLRPSRRLTLWNGPLECRLLTFPIAATAVRGEQPRWRHQARETRRKA